MRPMRGYGLPNSLRVTFGLLEENGIFFKNLEAVLAQPRKPLRTHSARLFYATSPVKSIGGESMKKFLTVLTLLAGGFIALMLPRAIYADWQPYSQRYAIIVMGGHVTGPPHYQWYWNDTSSMYRELISCGFTGDNIYFLSYGDSADAHPDWVDAASTTENIGTAYQWAQSQCTASDLLYIYWVDHGSPTYFNTYDGTITHTELGTLMQPIVAKQIIGAYNPCYSGAVIDDISRIGVITATSQDASHPNSWGWAGQWRRALRDAAEDSIDTNEDGYISLTEAYNWIAPRSQGAGEHSMFDDNGDGVGHEWGHTGYDPEDPLQDGYNGTFYSLDGWWSLPSGTTWVAAGNISGVWDSTGSPYMIYQGDVTVASGQTLLIGPGVRVEFTGHYKFIVNVDGLLQAAGTEKDLIVFTTDTMANPDRWGGIRFEHAHDSCRMVCCVIQYGRAQGSWPDYHGGGVYCYVSSPAFMNCTISNNVADEYGGGVSCVYASPTFTNCSISDNCAAWGGGVYCVSFPWPSFTNCIISGNTSNGLSAGGGGVYCEQCSPPFANCTIIGNAASNNGGGMLLWKEASSILTNCIITENSAGRGGGVSLEHFCSPTLTNCTISGNFADSIGGGVNIETSSPTFNSTIIAFSTGSGIYFRNSAACTVEYCDIFGNSGGDIAFYNNDPSQGPPDIGVISQTNANGDSCDIYVNIFLNPMFADTAASDFHLTEYSHCIGAADPTDPPPTDKDGNPRPNPPGSPPDVGAYENELGTPIVLFADSLVISISSGNAVLNWSGFGATYNIYGSDEPFVVGTFLDSSTDTTWTDSDTSNRPSPYLYYVTATE